MSFGRKGLASGQIAPLPARPLAAADPDAAEPAAPDPLAGLRNGARPATRREEPLGQQWSPLSAAERQRARESGFVTVRRNPDKRFIFGEPHKRSLALAYVFWFIAGQGSLHRFYCGQSQSAIMQIGLLVGSVLIGLVFAPIAVVGIFAWFFWIIADLFLIPGVMRRFKEEYAPDYGGVFA